MLAGIKFILSISPSHNTVLRIILHVLRPYIRKQAKSAGDGEIQSCIATGTTAIWQRKWCDLLYEELTVQQNANQAWTLPLSKC